MQDLTVGKPRPIWRSRVWVGVFSLIAIISVVAAGIFFFLRARPVSLEPFQFAKYTPIPSIFIVNDSYLLPPANQLNRGTCWIFAPTYILESQYRHQGIMNGYLRSDEYLKLSEEAIGQGMVKFCRENPQTKPCFGSGREEGKVSSGSVEQYLDFIRFFKNFKQHILPDTSCHYQDVEDESTIRCPNSTIDAPNNPLDFEITSTEFRFGIDPVKHMLFEAQKPITFSITNPVNRYWFPCTEPIVADSQVCLQKLYPCPNDEENFCGPVEYHLSKPHFSEHLFRRGNDMTPGVPHAIVTVGYNDEFVEPVSVNITQRPPSKGGFILRNSWGSHGHSLEYLSGEITRYQENSLCPNSDDPLGWIPATFECMQKENNPSSCSTDLRKVMRDHPIVGAQELRCVNATHCDPTKRYVLMRDPTSDAPFVRITKTGLPLGSVIEFSEATEPRIREITSLPFPYFYYAFELVKDKVENDPTHCGYYFFHYDTVVETSKRQDPYRATWRAVRIDVEWTKESYAASYTKKKNYTRVLESTYHFSTVKTNNPAQLFTPQDL